MNYTRYQCPVCSEEMTRDITIFLEHTNQHIYDVFKENHEEAKHFSPQKERGNKMKNLMFAIGMTIVVLMLLLPDVGWSQVANNVQGHVALAQSYQEHANLARQVVLDHQLLKAENGKPVGIFASKSNTPLVRKTDRYYDATILEAERSAAHYEALAQWHQMRAKELGRIRQ